MKFRIVFLLLTLLLCVSIVAAQAACPDIVETALQTADSLCAGTGRNQACYGNFALTAEAQSGATGFKFDQAGDITDVANISRLKLEPMNTAANTWGMVIMQLQANLPDTMPGQSVTFVLFGDVQLENAAQPNQNPMQAFYLQSGVGDAPCAEAPESGMMVQTPQGVGQVTFNVNGVDVQMGSTVTLQAHPGDKMVVRTLEGSASMNIDGENYPVLQGTELSAPLDEGMNINADELTLDKYTEDVVDDLPLNLLQREITPVELTDEQFDQVFDDIQSGAPLCGDDGVLPSCDDVSTEFGGEACVYEPVAGSPLCAEANPCTFVAADIADACQENLQTSIDNGTFTGDTEIDFGDPCSLVAAEFADSCKSGAQEAIDNGGPILPDTNTENPPEDTTTEPDTDTDGNNGGDNGGGSNNDGGSDGGGGSDNSGGDNSGSDNSGGDNGGGDNGGGDNGGGGGD